MEAGEKARNSVAHEGVMPDTVRHWELDLSRVGLVRTMLTALIARVFASLCAHAFGVGHRRSDSRISSSSVSSAP